ncbi:(Fe-S)-binding protein [Myxococcota bacterium]|nr:(Fe-S)-binding protein [Myxococcota bacterium]
MPELFGRVNRASVRILAANGFDVWVPREQTCCGALHAHSGDLDSARNLAERNKAAFNQEQGEPFDALLSNLAGCGAALRDMDQWLTEGSGELEGKAKDVTEFLDEVGWREPLRSFSARVCYDDPCHLIHAQGVASAPRRLLSLIPDLEMIPHANPDRCCGAAGTYNLLQSEMAESILEEKLDDLEAANPEWILTGNPGCLMQLQGGVQSRRWDAKVAHPVELLADALIEAEPDPD